METLLTMSKTELNRLEVMQKLSEKRMTQAVAADLLGISVRQVKRLLGKYRQTGAAGLVPYKAPPNGWPGRRQRKRTASGSLDSSFFFGRETLDSMIDASTKVTLRTPTPCLSRERLTKLRSSV